MMTRRKAQVRDWIPDLGGFVVELPGIAPSRNRAELRKR
jgi:hypothetical protein